MDKRAAQRLCLWMECETGFMCLYQVVTSVTLAYKISLDGYTGYNAREDIYYTTMLYAVISDPFQTHLMGREMNFHSLFW